MTCALPQVAEPAADVAFANTVILICLSP